MGDAAVRDVANALRDNTVNTLLSRLFYML